MKLRNAILALFAGFAAFLLATVAVTDLLESQIEFSVLVGLPVGILAWLVVMWFVYSRLTQPGPGGRQAATAIIAAAVGFVIGLSLPATFGIGLTTSLGIAVAVAILAALLSYTKDHAL